MVSWWFLVEHVEIYQMTYRYRGSYHFLIPKNYWYTLLKDIAAGGGYPPDGFVYTSIYSIYAAYRIYRIYAAAYILHCSTLRLHTLKTSLLKFGLEPTLRGAGLAWGAQVRAF